MEKYGLPGTQISGMSGIAPQPVTDGKARILFLIDEIGGIAEGGTERQVLQLIELATRLGYEPRLAVLRGTEWLTAEQAGCPIYCAGGEQSAASFRVARMRQAGAMDAAGTNFAGANIFCGMQRLWSVAGSAGGGAGDRRFTAQSESMAWVAGVDGALVADAAAADECIGGLCDRQQPGGGGRDIQDGACATAQAACCL